jgi:ParB-like chromosome segregation protein Spo0J
MKSERREIALGQLCTPERNSRIHSTRQLAELQRSLKKFGQIRDLVVDADGQVLAGNGVFKAMQALGWAAAWCLVLPDISEHDKIKLMLADNKTAGLGFDSLNNIEFLLNSLAGDFDIPGYADDILQSLVGSANEISAMLTEYGKAAAANLEEIARHAGVNEPEAAGGLPAAPVEAADSDTAARRFVVCPRCGEKVYL